MTLRQRIRLGIVGCGTIEAYFVARYAWALHRVELHHTSANVEAVTLWRGVALGWPVSALALFVALRWALRDGPSEEPPSPRRPVGWRPLAVASFVLIVGAVWFGGVHNPEVAKPDTSAPALDPVGSPYSTPPTEPPNEKASLDSAYDACTVRDKHVCSPSQFDAAQSRRRKLHSVSVARHSMDSANACRVDGRDSTWLSGRRVLSFCGYIRTGLDTLVFP